MNPHQKNPHLLKKIWAKKPPSEAQSLTQSNSLFSNQQQTKAKSSLLTNLSEEPTLRQDNPAFSHSSKSQQQSNPKFSFADVNGNNRQARPNKVEVHQTPNSSVIIIADNSASCSEQSGGDSSGSPQGDAESDGSGGGEGPSSGDQPCNPRKKIKRENDHCRSQQPTQTNQTHPQPQPARINLYSSNRNSTQSRQAFDIESNCSTNDMQIEDPLDFSPLIGFAQSAKNEYQKEEEFKLDDESLFPDSTTCSDEDNAYLKEAFDIAAQFEGFCASKRCASDKTLLQFKCKLGHAFELNLEDVRGKWCPRCHKNLQNLREYALSHKGKVLNSYYDDRINYQCEKNHTWSISNKNAQKRWCSQCAKEERKAVKQQFQQESQKKQQVDAEMQKKLFEEARKNTQIPSNSQSNAQSFKLPYKQAQPSANEGKKNMIEYFEKIEANVDRLARKNASEYMTSKDFNGQCTQEQVLQVYKVTLMPEEIFKSYMFNLPLDALKADYRRLVKLVHPDKNKHPHAGTAFQKIHKIYEQAVSKLAPAS